MLATATTFRSFLGRSEELGHLLQRRREAGGARGGLVLISGNAGSGKSRLVAEFRARLDAGRMNVAVAQCRESSNRPYSAIIDGLARLGGSANLVAAASRAELFSRIQRQIRDIAERRTIVLLIEDIHWATSDTLELLEAIVSDAASMRLLVVATHRSGEPAEDSPAFVALVRLHRLPQTTHLILEPLSDTIVGELLEEADSRIALGTRRRIVRLSEGNPFFAEELLRSAEMQERTRTGGDIPFVVRGLLQERFGRLDESEREVLAQASVIGRRFSLEMLEQILGASRGALVRALRSARDVHLIAEEEPGVFAFVHALTREAILSTLLDAQACELHRRVGLALEEHPQRDSNVHELAYHWWAARDPQRAFTYGVQAGKAAMSVFAYEEAALAYSYALAYADRTSVQLGPLLMDLGMAYGRSGLKNLAHSALADAKAAFFAAGDLAGECEAAVEEAAARYTLDIPEPGKPIEEMLPRLDALGNKRLQNRADVALAQLHILAGRFVQGAQVLERVQLDAAVDDPRTVTTYFAMQGALAAREGDVARYIAVMRRASTSALERGLTNEPAMILCNLAAGLTRLGYLAEATEAYRESEAIVNEMKLAAVAKFLEMTAITRATLTGDLKGARSLIERFSQETVEAADLRAFVAGWALFVALLVDDGELRDRYFSPELALLHPLPHLAAATAQRLRALGQDPQADDLIEKSLDRDEGGRGSFVLHLAAAHSTNGALQWKARAQLAALARAPQDRVFGPAIELFDAIVAAACGDNGKSAQSAARAAKHFNALGFPLWQAQALELCSEPEQAAAIYRRIGATSLLRSAVLERRAKKSSSEMLSPRELEVAELVASGATNAAVAAKMSITVKAVEKHLSSIYLKLAISSRAQLASQFGRRGR